MGDGEREGLKKKHMKKTYLDTKIEEKGKRENGGVYFFQNHFYDRLCFF